MPQVFEKHCVNAWDDDRNAWRSCFSDEHYFATVIATQGLDEVSLSPTYTTFKLCCLVLTYLVTSSAPAGPLFVLVLPCDVACKQEALP